MRGIQKSILLILLLVHACAFAERVLLVGPEWEFSDEVGRASTADRRYGGAVEIAMRDRLVARLQEILKKSKDGATYSVDGRNHLLFLPEYGWIKFDTDPSVIEVHSSPRTIAEFRLLRPQLKKYVFNAAKSAGFSFTAANEAAHMHFDFNSAFGLDPGFYDYLLFRNFVVDFYNHFEIFTGVLEYDTRNAPGLTKAERANLAEAFFRFEKSLNPEEFRRVPAHKLAQLIHTINTRVYPHAHYIALNLEHAVEGNYIPAIRPSGTFEVRSLTMRTLDNWLNVADIFQARLNWLEGQDNLIELIAEESELEFTESAARFRTYVTETGISWDVYRLVMDRDHRSADRCSQAMLNKQTP